MHEYGSDFVFLPLGGSGEIGMNLNLYGYKDKWLIVDFGITFGDELGIDIITPDISFLEANKDKIVGMVLTHAHEDHIGAIPYLWKRLGCPMYATPFTASIIRHKLRDAGVSKGKEVVTVPLGGEVDLDPFKVEFVTLTHSIPEPNALAIKTDEGVVLHTGDWKIDPEPLVGEVMDKDRLNQLGDEGVLALVCDSTNVFSEGRTESEGPVRESLTKLIAGKENRVAVALFASNVARVETCAIAAAENGRVPVLVGRSLDRMVDAALEAGYLKSMPKCISPEEAAGMPKDKVLYLCTGSQGESRAALTRLADKTHQSLKLEEGDTVIFSSRIIPGNEKSIGQIKGQLQASGITVIADGKEFTHVSGHPARDDLRDMYNMVRPQILIPVHGELAHMTEQAKLGESSGIPLSVVPYNGSVIRLSPGQPQVIDDVPTGRWGYDGNRVVPLYNEHIRERLRVMRDGAAFVTLTPESEDEPYITFLGLAANEDEEDLLLKLALREMAEMLDAEDETVWDDDDRLDDISRISIRRAARKVCGRKPHVVTHVVRGE